MENISNICINKITRQIGIILWENTDSYKIFRKGVWLKEEVILLSITQAKVTMELTYEDELDWNNTAQNRIDYILKY